MTTITIRVSPQDATLIYDKMQERLIREEAWEPEEKRREVEETLKECEEVEETIRRIGAILQTLNPLARRELPSIRLADPEQAQQEIQLPIEHAQLIRNELTEAKDRLEKEVKHVKAILQTLSKTIR